MPGFKSRLFSGAAMLATRDVHDETGEEEREVSGRTRFLTFCACLVALLELTGCMLGPKYKAPVVAVQPLHNSASLAARNGNASPPSLDIRWSGFNDPELILVVERALHENLDLLAASLARIEQARAAA